MAAVSLAYSDPKTCSNYEARSSTAGPVQKISTPQRVSRATWRGASHALWSHWLGSRRGQGRRLLADLLDHGIVYV